MNIVEFINVSKQYGEIKVFEHLNFVIPTGVVTVLCGPSGCGKTTVLNLIGLLDGSYSGEIRLFGSKAPPPFKREANQLLRHRIGYLFQNYALVENKTVRYNLEIALTYIKGDKKAMVSAALEKVGLKGFEDKLVFQCSGGEQQRVAIARLLLKPCDLVLCDEPTGSLDGANRDAVLALIDLLKKEGKTVVIVTHDKEVMNFADNLIRM